MHTFHVELQLFPQAENFYYGALRQSAWRTHTPARTVRGFRRTLSGKKTFTFTANSQFRLTLTQAEERPGGFLLPSRPHQLLEQVSHGDLLVPLLDAGQQGVVELLVDFEDVLDFVEDGVHLLDGEDGLGGGGRGFQRTHRLGRERKQTETLALARGQLAVCVCGGAGSAGSFHFTMAGVIRGLQTRAAATSRRLL